MKLGAAFVISLCSLIAGLGASKSLIRSEKLLKQLCELFSFFEDSFRTTNTLTADMLNSARECGRFKELTVLEYVCNGLKLGGTLSELWSDGASALELPGEVRGELALFGYSLGTSDCDGQMRLCGMYAQSFKRLYDEAKEKRKKLSGVYVSLGAAGAACVMLMLV